MATNLNAESQIIKTSNTPLYWGVAILAAVIIALALFMKPTRLALPITNGLGTTAEAMNINNLQQWQINPATNRPYTTDPTTGAIIQNNNSFYDPNQDTQELKHRHSINGMPTDPRTEQLHNGANSPNGGIDPNDTHPPGN